MHILYFHQHFSTPDGAAGTRSYEMARRLLRQGHSVTMVCGSYSQGATGLAMPFHKGCRRGTIDGINVVEFDLRYANEDGFIRRSGVFVKFALASIKLALREKYDLAFATTTPLTAGIPGIFARWLRGKPFVFEVRDLWPELPRAMGVITNPVVLGAMSVLEWISYRSATRCIGLSPGIVDGIARRGVPASRISMIPNGCDVELFSEGGPAANSFRQANNISQGQLLAVYCGTHGLANGLDALIDAGIELRNRGRTDIILALIGKGQEKARLVERVKAERLTNVRFFDPVSKRRLTSLLREADLGLQILRNIPEFAYGTSPNKFFDYLSVGLPVLNNYPGWLAGMIDQHELGFAVQPDSPVAFADALQQAAEDRVALAAMGHNAAAFARGSMSREYLSGQWVDWVTAGLKRNDFEKDPFYTAVRTTQRTTLAVERR
ncbi:glycosyltransferase family 4 protein [Sphingobium sp. CFD-2]|uniref:glycosyltransferase family 4 protein n=1 Tax=Sphingobium sp. CFD-2 TaxID=2878542 RepID=UPI00214BB613|nr:glycosyltransferase family 4 protein [Sphingobium sp. CFD-2]